MKLNEFNKNIIKNRWKKFAKKNTACSRIRSASGVTRKKERVFSLNPSWLKWSLKLQWEGGVSDKMNIKYLNTESSNSKTVQGVPKSLIRR